MTHERSSTAAGTWLSLKEAARVLDLRRSAVERRVLKGKLRGRFVAGEIQVLLDKEGRSPAPLAEAAERDTPAAPEDRGVAEMPMSDEAIPTAERDATPIPGLRDEPLAVAADETPLEPGVDETPSARDAESPSDPRVAAQSPTPELDEERSASTPTEAPQEYIAQQAERSLAIVDAVSQLVAMQVQPLIAEIRVLYERNEALARENGQLQERVRQAEQRLADAELRADAAPVLIPPDIERTSALAERLRQAVGFAAVNEAPPQVEPTTSQAEPTALQAEPLTPRAEPATSHAERTTDTAEQEAPATQPATVGPLPTNGLHSPSETDRERSEAALSGVEPSGSAALEETRTSVSAVEDDSSREERDAEEGAFTASWWATVTYGDAAAPAVQLREPSGASSCASRGNGGRRARFCGRRTGFRRLSGSGRRSGFGRRTSCGRRSGCGERRDFERRSSSERRRGYG